MIYLYLINLIHLIYFKYISNIYFYTNIFFYTPCVKSIHHAHHKSCWKSIHHDYETIVGTMVLENSHEKRKEKET